jgi:hypothetical protein
MKDADMQEVSPPGPGTKGRKSKVKRQMSKVKMPRGGTRRDDCGGGEEQRREDDDPARL